jgi:hypothetical protein
MIFGVKSASIQMVFRELSTHLYYALQGWIDYALQGWIEAGALQGWIEVRWRDSTWQLYEVLSTATCGHV